MINSIMSILGNFGLQFMDVMSTFRPFVDLLDIVIFAYILYKLFNLVRETRAEQLLKGIILIAVIYFFAWWWNMHTLKWLLENVFQYGLIAIAVIFQPEIRRALERVGRSNLKGFGRGLAAEEAVRKMEQCLDAIAKSCQSMSKSKTGALIVIERTTALGDIVTTGTEVDATPTQDLICNIFFPKAPLHDGAMLIRDARIHSAGCILPLSQNFELSKDLGTRHRAALGMSENSDAITVIVSEETGIISMTRNGDIERDFNYITLKDRLFKEVFGDGEETKKRKLLRRLFGERKDKKNKDDKDNKKDKDEE